MADDVTSSPLSSPPESVGNVMISSPVKARARIPSSSPPQKPTVEAAQELADLPITISSTGHEEATGPPSPHESDDGVQSSTQKRKASISRRSVSSKKPRHASSAPKKSAKDKKWEAPFVYTDSRSPLAQADLRAILLHPDAWDVLTAEEKQEVLAKFPDETHISDAGTPNARPNPMSLRNDDNFRHDCARYCENIELGRHDEEWLSQAWIAHEKHKRGDFDGFLRDQFQEEWDTELPEERGSGDPEPTESKEGVPEPTESSHLGAQAAPAPQHNPVQSYPSSQRTIEGPHEELEDNKKIEHQKHDADMRQGLAAMGDSKTLQATGASSTNPTKPSDASSEQKEETSIVIARSD